MTKEPSPDANAAAQYLYDAIKSHWPGFKSKARPAVLGQLLTGWAKAIDVGYRQDGMDLEGCKVAIDVAHRGREFWQRNVLSGAKLRKHYDALHIEARQAGSSQRHGAGYTSDGERLDEIDFDIYGTGAS